MRRFPLAALFATLAACSNEGDVVRGAPGCGEPVTSSGALTAGTTEPASAEELVAALGGPAPASLPAYGGAPYAAAVFGGLGTVEATEGDTLAWLSTGVAGANTPSTLVADAAAPQYGTVLGSAGCGGTTFDCAVLSWSFVVPEDHHAVRFDFTFLSTEYPEFLGDQYNDRFSVALESPSFTFANVVYDAEGNAIEIKNALFVDDECAEDLAGTGFELYDADFGNCDAGATGLLGTIAPVAPGETVTLTFTLYDEGDGLYDSAVAIDRLETVAVEVEGPRTDDCD